MPINGIQMQSLPGFIQLYGTELWDSCHCSPSQFDGKNHDAPVATTPDQVVSDCLSADAIEN